MLNVIRIGLNFKHVFDRKIFQTKITGVKKSADVLSCKAFENNLNANAIKNLLQKFLTLILWCLELILIIFEVWK